MSCREKPGGAQDRDVAPLVGDELHEHVGDAEGGDQRREEDQHQRDPVLPLEGVDRGGALLLPGAADVAGARPAPRGPRPAPPADRRSATRTVVAWSVERPASACASGRLTSASVRSIRDSPLRTRPTTRSGIAPPRAADGLQVRPDLDAERARQRAAENHAVGRAPEARPAPVDHLLVERRRRAPPRPGSPPGARPAGARCRTAARPGPRPPASRRARRGSRRTAAARRPRRAPPASRRGRGAARARRPPPPRRRSASARPSCGRRGRTSTCAAVSVVFFEEVLGQAGRQRERDDQHRRPDRDRRQRDRRLARPPAQLRLRDAERGLHGPDHAPLTRRPRARGRPACSPAGSGAITGLAGRQPVEHLAALLVAGADRYRPRRGPARRRRATRRRPLLAPLPSSASRGTVTRVLDDAGDDVDGGRQVELHHRPVSRQRHQHVGRLGQPIDGGDDPPRRCAVEDLTGVGVEDDPHLLPGASPGRRRARRPRRAGRRSARSTIVSTSSPSRSGSPARWRIVDTAPESGARSTTHPSRSSREPAPRSGARPAPPRPRRTASRARTSSSAGISASRSSCSARASASFASRSRARAASTSLARPLDARAPARGRPAAPTARRRRHGLARDRRRSDASGAVMRARTVARRSVSTRPVA